MLVDGARLTSLYTWLSRLVDGLFLPGGALVELALFDADGREQVTASIMDFLVPVLPSQGPIDDFWEFAQLCLITGVCDSEIQRVIDMQRMSGRGTQAAAKRAGTEREAARRALRTA